MAGVECFLPKPRRYYWESSFIRQLVEQVVGLLEGAVAVTPIRPLSIYALLIREQCEGIPPPHLRDRVLPKGLAKDYCFHDLESLDSLPAE